jgi:hypothetical protein
MQKDYVDVLTCSLFGWLVADGWCWFVLREEYCWLVAGGCFVLREKYCWLVADKPSEQASGLPMSREVAISTTTSKCCSASVTYNSAGRPLAPELGRRP